MGRFSAVSLQLSSIIASGSIAATLLIPVTSAAQTQTPDLNATGAQTSGVQSQGNIIVTAQRREERLQSVPIAITALSAEAIANQGITSLKNLSTAVPNLNIALFPKVSDTLTFTMRGQGAGDVGQLTRDGGVGLYVDGFYIGRPQGALLDLGEPERIEVLRGPQGTLYGRNITGGAVNIITRKPSEEWGGTASFSYGSRNLVRALASVDTAAVGNLALRGSIAYTKQDGWTKNVGYPRDFGEVEQVSWRVAAKWTPTERLTVNYAYDQGRGDTTPLYFVNPDLATIIPGYNNDPDRTYGTISPLDYSTTKFVDHQLTIDYELGDNLTLRSLSGYRGLEYTSDTNFGLALSTSAFPIGSTSQEYLRTRQYSQEVQLIGNLTGRLDFTSGVFYYREKGGHDDTTTTDLIPFGFSTSRTAMVEALSKSFAAYLQSTWNPAVFDDKIKLTVGGRYTRDKRSASRFAVRDGAIIDPGSSNRQKFSNFSPMANLAVQWTPDIMTYAKFSKGYKAGGSAERGPNFAQTFGPEKVTAWEAGIKTQLLNRMLTFNLAAFYNKFDDLQLDLVIDPVDVSIGATYNAGKASIKGLELETVFQPTPDFLLRGSFSYLKGKVSKVVVVPGSIYDGPYGPNDNIAGLFTLPFVPKFSWSIGGDWMFLRVADDELSAHATYSRQSPVFASASGGPDVPGRNFFRSDAARNLDARIKWRHPIPAGKAISFSVFAENLLNDRYSGFVIGLGGTNLSGYRAQAAPYNEPRTIGGELKVEF